MWTRRGIILSALLLSTGALVSCTTKLVPVAGPESQVDPRTQAVSRTQGGVTVTVRPEAWDYPPTELPRHVLPLLVTIVNGRTEEITFSRQSVTLLDDKKRQIASLTPEAVTASFGGWPGSGVYPSVGVGAAGPSPTIFGVGIGISFGGERNVPEIVPRALAEGAIRAGAQGEGFLYFAPPAADARVLTLLLSLLTHAGKTEWEFLFQFVK